MAERGCPGLGHLIARLDRIEAMLAADAGPATDLADLLAEATGGAWVTAGEAWGLAREQAMGAALDARPEPALSIALRAAEITNAHALARWLARQPGMERAAETRAGVLWRVCGFDPAEGRETA